MPLPKPDPAKMHEIFRDTLDGFTSDHAPQNMQITETEQEADGTSKETPLKLKTWNLLKECHASNNPFKITETPDQFRARRTVQYNQIIDELKKGNLDCMFLQEADELLAPPLSSESQAFEAELKQLGFEIKKHKATATNSGLVTIINTNKLEVVDSPTPVFGDAGFSVPVRLKSDPSKKIELTNLHLQFEHDYKKEILEHQFQKIREGVFSVMGGDFNHNPANPQIVGMIADHTKPTVVASGVSGELILTDHKTKHSPKVFDGFLANPGSSTSTVEAIELEGGGFFEEDPATKKMKLTPKGYGAALLARSSPGEPYIDKKQECAGIIKAAKQAYPPLPKHAPPPDLPGAPKTAKTPFLKLKATQQLSEADKAYLPTYSQECKNFFEQQIKEAQGSGKPEYQNVAYKPIKPTAENGYTVGELRRSAPSKEEELLATLKYGSIECPTAIGLTDNVQNFAFLTFLKFESKNATPDGPTIIEINNFSPENLTSLLQLLDQDPTRIPNIILELPPKKEQCTYGDPPKCFTDDEHRAFAAKIQKYHDKPFIAEEKGPDIPSGHPAASPKL